MKKDYDGLNVVRIPFTTADIFTQSTTTCIQNVQWLVSGTSVCTSEHDAAFCQDLDHSKNYEWVTPGDSSWGEMC